MRVNNHATSKEYSMAEQAFMLLTLYKVEKGDPSVSMGIYPTVELLGD